MKKPDLILLDMDGVIADFIFGVAQLFNVPVERFNSWDVFNIIGVSEQQFWDTISAAGEGFWANLPKYDWSDELVETCNSLAPTYIVTSPGYCVPAGSGKMSWLMQYYPQFLKSGRFYICQHKSLLAKAAESVLLIDDNDKNCTKFCEAGGDALMLPQPWNIRSGVAQRIVFDELKSIEE